MAVYPLQVAGLVLGALGLAGALAATLLPQWRVSAFVGSNIVVLERTWEGLWMSCVRQAWATLQCKPYSSLLALPPALEAARALACSAVALALVALPVGVCGLRQVRCAGAGPRVRAGLAGAAGVLLLLSGLLLLAPVSWTAHRIIRDFHDPVVHVGRKRELGAVLFVGWAGAAALLAGGGLLCAASCCGWSGRGPPCPALRDRPPCGGPREGPRGGPLRGPHRGPAAPQKPFASYV